MFSKQNLSDIRHEATESSRLLLLMTTHTYRAGAFLAAAQRLNVPVVVGSERAQILASANLGGNLTLDFNRPEEAVGGIVNFARRCPIAAVLSADDEGAIIAARAAEALGLRHSSVTAVQAARNKHRMRQILESADVPSPEFRLLPLGENPHELAQQARFPCVLKPLFLSGSRGVIRANDDTEFVDAFHRITAILRTPDVAVQGGALAGSVLVEEFISGVEVSLEGLLTHGNLKVLAIFDKPDPLNGPFFEETIYVTPSRLSQSQQDQIVATTREAIEALGLREGPVHVELRVNEAGVWVIEIAPRSIGGLCSRALRFEGGVSLEELILRHALGQPVDALPRERCAAGVMMIPIPRPGILRRVDGVEEAGKIAGIEGIRITIPTGQTLVPLPEGTRYLGFIFARAESPAEVESALRQAHAALKFEIAPLTGRKQYALEAG